MESEILNQEVYEFIHDFGDTYWWHVGMRKFYFNLLDEFYEKGSSLTILDAGCGTGIMLKHLQKYGFPIGIDISKDALHFSRLREYEKILRASVEALPFVDEAFDLIAALEVIYHLQVKNDSKALEEFHRVLKKNGRIIVCVPAYNFLRSEHDEAIQTRQRYTKGELRSKMEHAGFRAEKVIYVNTFLFPFIAILRFINRFTRPKNINPPKSDFKAVPFFVNQILIFVLAMEAKLLQIINFPFGLSILCIAQKI